MACNPIVFLICSERSGSNLIRVILDAHPQIFAPLPLHLGRDIVAHFHAAIVHKNASKSWEHMMMRIVKRVKRLYGVDMSEKIFNALDTIGDFSLSTIYRAVYSTLSEEKQYTILFLKENNLHKFLFALLYTFPDAKFVFQVRDPRDYLASAKGLRNRWLGNKFGSNKRALELWREEQLCGLSALFHLGAERVFLQRYEDLTADPETVLTQLCAFLCIDYQPAMLEFYKRDATIKSATLGKALENLQKPLMTHNSGGYKSKLTHSQIRMVEAYLGNILERFGYSCDYPESKNPSLFRSFLPYLTEPLEKFINKERRPFYSDGGQDHGFMIESDADKVPLPYSGVRR